MSSPLYDDVVQATSNDARAIPYNGYIPQEWEEDPPANPLQVTEEDLLNPPEPIVPPARCLCNKILGDDSSPCQMPKDCYQGKMTPGLKFGEKYDAFNELGTHYSRLVDSIVGGDWERSRVEIIAYEIEKQSAHYVWLKGRGPNWKPFVNQPEIFRVAKKANRTFAYPTIALAENSWKHRKRSQIYILERQLNHVYKALDKQEEKSFRPRSRTSAYYE